MEKLGDRMKENYENISRHYLMKRTPVILRIDGKSFHSFTKGLERPFDETLIDSLVKTATLISKEMQGFKLGYCQSDEMSFLLTDYDNIETEAWFGYNIQKLSSVSASLATAYFNSIFKHDNGNLAIFDCRAFNMPIDEVVNYFLWRAKDWRRNSISMYARSKYSHKQLHGLSTAKILEKLDEDGYIWEKECTLAMQRGTFIEGPEKTLKYPLPEYEKLKNEFQGLFDISSHEFNLINETV